jgi:hypothetical protein
MPLQRQPRSYYTAWSEYLAQDACDFVCLGLALWTLCQLHLFFRHMALYGRMNATRHAALSPHPNILHRSNNALSRVILHKRTHQ